MYIISVGYYCAITKNMKNSCYNCTGNRKLSSWSFPIILHIKLINVIVTFNYIKIVKKLNNEIQYHLALICLMIWNTHPNSCLHILGYQLEKQNLYFIQNNLITFMQVKKAYKTKSVKFFYALKRLIFPLFSVRIS